MSLPAGFYALRRGKQLGYPVLPTKGVKNGLCNRVSCLAPDAQWFNHATKAYYCTSCAELLNAANPETLALYGYALCTLD